MFDKTVELLPLTFEFHIIISEMLPVWLIPKLPLPPILVGLSDVANAPVLLSEPPLTVINKDELRIEKKATLIFVFSVVEFLTFVPSNPPMPVTSPAVPLQYNPTLVLVNT